MSDNDAEQVVSRFYNNKGWNMNDGTFEDAKRFEDLRKHSSKYVSNCRLRVLRHIPAKGGKILDMASGPIQYLEYMEFSRNFNEHHCVDFSADALEIAKVKLGDKCFTHHGNFFDLEFEENSFDCIISLHTIYHIHADLQEKAVRKLISLAKPETNVIIVYSNPHTLFSKLERFRWFSSVVNRKVVTYKSVDTLYFYPHALTWWKKFEDQADLKILPWRSFGSDHQKAIFPDNFLGSTMLKLLFILEDRFPKFFASNFQYPMIVLKKR
jgi:ubiquinone/menaquinone biosynthesis C-methylase UbiE